MKAIPYPFFSSGRRKNFWVNRVNPPQKANFCQICIPSQNTEIGLLYLRSIRNPIKCFDGNKHITNVYPVFMSITNHILNSFGSLQFQLILKMLHRANKTNKFDCSNKTNILIFRFVSYFWFICNII